MHTSNEQLGRIQEQFRPQALAYERLTSVTDAAARRRVLENLRFVLGDVERMPLADRAFDVAVRPDSGSRARLSDDGRGGRARL
jgi:hypothetical protein